MNVVVQAADADLTRQAYSSTHRWLSSFKSSTRQLTVLGAYNAATMKPFIDRHGMGWRRRGEPSLQI